MAFTKLEPTSVNTSAAFTFANANISANLNVSGKTNLGSVSNVTITGGTNGYVLKTDGAGNLSWTAQTGGGGGGTPGGNTTEVQFNNAGSFDGKSTFTFNNSTNTLTVTNITSNGYNLTSLNGSNITGQVGNALLSGTVYTNAQPNITSVGTLSSLSITGNVSSGNANLGNVAIANYFIGDGSLLTGLPASYSNTNVAAYLPTYTGNVAGNYFIGNGATLTYITGGNVIGNVTNAVQSHYANIANSISGTNVSGNVSSAVQSHYANIANSVSGTNVSGNVSSAVQSHYANIANSVTGGNVSGQVGNALIAGTVYTNAQPNITSTGILHGLIVSGNIIPETDIVYNLGNTTNRFKDLYLSGNTLFLGVQTISTDANGITMSGNISGDGSLLTNLNANSIASGTLSSGRLSGSYTIDIVGSASNAGTVTTNAQPNITSVGTLTSLSVTGNVTAGNLTGATLVSATNLTGSLTTGSQPNITSTGTLTSVTVSGDATITGNLTVSGTYEYANVTSFNVKDPIIEQGGNPNGTPLTSNDGKDRGQILHYYSGAAIDGFMGWDNSNSEFAFGSNVSVSSEVVTFNNFGNVRASYYLGNGSQLTNLTGSSVFGNVTSAIQSHYANIANSVSGTNVSGNVTSAVQSHYANIANSVTGTNVSGNVTSAVQAHYANIANSVTGTNVSGNVTSAVQSHYANIANSVSGGNVSGQVANSLIAGTVYTNAQPNITSVGTLASLTVTSNVSAGNANLGNLVTANFFTGNGYYLTGLPATYSNTNVASYLPTYTGNVTAGNVLVGTAVVASTLTSNIATGTAPLTITSTTRVTNLNVSYANVSDYVAVTTQSTGNFYPVFVSANSTGNYALASNTNISVNVATGSLNVGSGTGGNISGANLITSNYFSGNGSLLTGITGANVTGYVPLATAANTAGTVTTGAQPNVTSLGTLQTTTIAANSNISMSGSLSQMSGANLISGTYITGTLTTAAQPNVTSLGTLASLTVTGNVSAGNLNAGTGVVASTLTSNIATGTAPLTITSTTRVTNLNVAYANVSDYGVVTTQSTGNFYPVFVSGSSTGNYALASNANISFNAANGALTVSNLISGSGTGGSISGANLVSANYFTGTLTTAAQPNITSTGTLTSLTSTGLITATSGGIKVGNIQDPSGTNTIQLSSGSITVTGNITAGGGGTGNVTATYFIGNGSQLTGLPATYSNTNVASYLPTYTGNVTAGNVLVGTAVVASTLTSNIATGTAPLTITSTTRVSNLNVSYANVSDYGVVTTQSTGNFYPVFVSGNTTGNYALASNANISYNAANGALTVTNLISGSGTGGSISGANLVSANYFTGTLTTAAQPNITSTGTLTSLVVTGNITAGNLTGATLVSATNLTGSLTTAAQSNITSLGSLVGLTVTGNLVMQQSQEKINVLTTAGGATTYDYTLGSTVYHQAVTSNITATVSNFDATANRASVFAMLIAQGVTPFTCTSLTINSTATTIKWSGGTQPTGTASKTDAIVFTIINNAGTYVVMGQQSSYG